MTSNKVLHSSYEVNYWCLSQFQQ